MRHANVRTTAEIYGLDPDLTSAHREANTGVVKCFWESNWYQVVLFQFLASGLSSLLCWLLGQDSNLEPFG